MLNKELVSKADSGDAVACNEVGNCYYEGRGVQKDISKAVHYYSLATQKGNLDATYSLGYCYETGEGVEKDVSQSIVLYEHAANAGYAKANRRLGFIFFWGDEIPPDFEKSFHYLKIAADAGDADAQTHVAQCYEGNMWGAPCEDLSLARHYYDLALAQNNAHALWCVGENYKSGRNGYPKDMNKAFDFFCKSAIRGSDKGQLAVAICYLNGEGTEKNTEEAIRWLEESTQQKNYDAMARLGAALLYGMIPISQENVDRGYKLIQEAVSNGDSTAQEVLSAFNKELERNHASLQSFTMTMLGEQAENQSNGALALEYYKAASDAGCSAAMCGLGRLFFQGVSGVEKNLNQAAEWYLKGANAGNAEAQAAIAACYIQGEGVPNNLREAEKWITKALEQGNQDALVLMTCLGDQYAEVPENYAKAEQCYLQVIESLNCTEENMANTKCSLGYLYARQDKISCAIPLWMEAAEKEHPIAQYGLGVCYYNGEGVAQNHEQAVYWWKRAASNGSQEAQADLIKFGNQAPQSVPTYSGHQNSNSGGCYIATAVYGNYDCPEVWTLRRFRDNILKRYFVGRVFIRMYYATSPYIVKIFGNKKLFSAICKNYLDKMVANLIKAGIENTLYRDK